MTSVRLPISRSNRSTDPLCPVSEIFEVQSFEAIKGDIGKISYNLALNQVYDLHPMKAWCMGLFGAVSLQDLERAEEATFFNLERSPTVAENALASITLFIGLATLSGGHPLVRPAEFLILSQYLSFAHGSH